MRQFHLFTHLKKACLLLTCYLMAMGICQAQANENEEASAFKRGNKMIYTDNFSKDAIGDFPAKWGSTQGGEIKKITGFEENFIKVPGGSIINMLLTKPLPQDFTLEYDVVVPAEITTSLPSICFSKN